MEKELHRIVTTCIIYNADKKFLVTKRSPDKKVHPNKWTVPGGGLSTDDYINTPINHGNNAWVNAIETALRREVMEEVNVEIGEPKQMSTLTFIRPDGIPVLVIRYYAPYISGEIKLDKDAVEYKWISFEEAKDLDLIEGIAQELEIVNNILHE